MPTANETLQAQARAISGTSGNWGEDMLAALRILQSRTDGHLSELIANAGGLPYLMAAGLTAAGFFASGINHFFSEAGFAAYTAGAKTLVTSANFASLGYTASGGANGTVVNSSGNFVAASAPRFQFSAGALAGLLIEGARTNGVTNSSMQGAAAGSPGTIPTRWTQGGGAGLTRTIALGTELGQPYIDIRWTGTTSDTQLALYTEDNMTIAASTSQARCHSAYVRMTAGSLTNISSTEIGILEQDSVGGFVTAAATPFTLTGSWQRAVRLHTTNATGTAYSKPYITLFYSSGVAIHIALRILLPQEEQGAFPTSPIVTAGTAVTRSADLVSLPVASIPSWSTTAGVLAAEAQSNNPVSAVRVVGSDATGDADFLEIGGTNSVQSWNGTASVGPATAASGSWSVGLRAAHTWGSGTRKVAIQNGASTASSATDIQTGSLTALYLGNDNTSASPYPLNGLFQRLSYAAGTQSDATMLQIVANTL